MAYSLLPNSIPSARCRIIYICLDPKDAIISYWHFCNVIEREWLPFDKFFEMFCKGNIVGSPIWDHSLEYWKESLRRHEKVLFFKYEEMLEEPVVNVKRLAEFVRCPFSEEEQEEEGGMVEEIIRLCSFERLKKLEVNKMGSRDAGVYKVANASYFRNGGIEDWRNHMSPEMAQMLDGIIQEKLEGSGLIIPGIGARIGEATADD